MTVQKFWPLDFDQEVEIYESPAWDLPGFTPSRSKRKPGVRRNLKSRRKEN